MLKEIHKYYKENASIEVANRIKSKLFTNLSYVFDFPINSSVKLYRIDGSMLSDLKINSRRNVALGVGYKFQDRYSVEIRYNTNRTILSDYLFWDSKYNGIHIILGYSIF